MQYARASVSSTTDETYVQQARALRVNKAAYVIRKSFANSGRIARPVLTAAVS